jgi:hypothetical protein
MRTPSDLVDDILANLGPTALGGNALILSISLRIIAEDCYELSDATDFRKKLHDLADAAKERAKRQAVSAV